MSTQLHQRRHATPDFTRLQLTREQSVLVLRPHETSFALSFCHQIRRITINITIYANLNKRSVVVNKPRNIHVRYDLETSLPVNELGLLLLCVRVLYKKMKI